MIIKIKLNHKLQAFLRPLCIVLYSSSPAEPEIRSKWLLLRTQNSGHQFLFKIEVLHFSPDGELMCRQYYCVHIQYNDLIFGYNSSRSGQGTRNMEVFLSLWSSSISVSYVRSVHNTFATILVEERLIPFFNTMVNPFI